MEGAPSESPVVCFGEFRLDLESGELRKNGSCVRLPPQPFRILVLLANRAGHVVTREEIQKQVWGDETFVDFEKSLNSCIKQIRAALADDAENPRYVETLPKRGYRFIASVTFDGNGHQPALAAAPAEEVPPAPTMARRGWLVAAVAVTLVAAAGLALWQPWRPRLSFQERDWVLITTFQNRTGEAIFDGMLEYALDRELSNSRFVNVAPRTRIDDALQLMKRPPGTPIDAALGREICLRDGGIRALLNGQIQKAGTHYLLSASLMDPASGATVASVSEEANNQNEILAAVRRLSNGVRETLGEQLPQIPPRNEKLEKATTSSLRALQLYSQGMAMVNQHKWEQAATLLRQAVSEDPDFASAHIYLAHELSNLRRDTEAAPHYQRAFVLAESTTEREKYFILGSYYGRFLKDDVKAVQAYEVLVRLYPDDYWGNNNLIVTYTRLGRLEETLAWRQQYAEMRPNDFGAQVGFARAFVFITGDLNRARPFIERAQALATPETDRLHPWETTAWFRLWQGVEYWAKAEPEKALAEVERLEKTLPVRRGREQEIFASAVSTFYWTLGKRKAALELGPKFGNANWLAADAFLKGDISLARKLYRDLADPGPASVIRMARLGLVREAEKALPLLATNPGWTEGAIQIVRGEIALAQGRTEEAVVLLQAGLRTAWSNTMTTFCGWESLATIWEQRDDLKKAAYALEKASAMKLVLVPIYSARWSEVRLRQARLYRRMGRIAEAREIEAELRKLLAVADEDYPVLVQLRQVQEQDARDASQPQGRAR